MKLKVGDKVVINRKIGNTTGVYDNQDIKEGIIYELWYSNNILYYGVSINGVKDDDINYLGLFEQEEVELVVENMNQEIEVGDEVVITNNSDIEGEKGVIVIEVRDNGYLVNSPSRGRMIGIYGKDKVKLVSKANKQEIVGYELLKDLPGIPAGTRSEEGVSILGYTFKAKGIHIAHFDGVQVKDTSWFEPIYKAKEVVVKISDNREVIIEKDKATIKGVDSMSLLEVKYLYDILNPVNKLGKHTMSITQDSKVKVGCQTFTKQDIQTVYNSLIKI